MWQCYLDRYDDAIPDESEYDNKDKAVIAHFRDIIGKLHDSGFTLPEDTEFHIRRQWDASHGSIYKKGHNFMITVNAFNYLGLTAGAIGALTAHEVAHLANGDIGKPRRKRGLLGNFLSRQDERLAIRQAMKLFPYPKEHIAEILYYHQLSPDPVPYGERTHPTNASEVCEVVSQWQILAKAGICEPVDDVFLRALPAELQLNLGKILGKKER